MPTRPDLLFEDKALLVLNKPCGLLSHRLDHSDEFSLSDMLADYSNLSDLGGPGRQGIVHRLDRFTEGLMVVAKRNNIHDALRQQFKDRTVQKAYYAVVYGDVKHDHFQIDKPVNRHPRKRHLRTVRPPSDPRAKPAVTDVELLHSFRSKSLVRVWPKTGRTHQIRVHLAHVGHPVIGDKDYAKKRQANGQLLQAYYLRFIHPEKQFHMSFSLLPSPRLGVPARYFQP